MLHSSALPSPCRSWFVIVFFFFLKDFPDSSVGKESACNARDPGSIPGSGRSTGEGIGYPLQYPWASLVAQLVKNPPAMWETWVWTLSWEDLLLLWEGKGYSLQYSGLENSMDCMGSQRVGHDWVAFTFQREGRGVRWRAQVGTHILHRKGNISVGFKCK